MKKIVVTAIASALSASLLSAAPVFAFQPQLSDSPYAKARSVVNVVFANYISGLTGVQIRTGLVDVDNDGVAEVFAEFIHSGSCKADMKTCRTVVLKHDANNWNIVLDRFAKNVDFSEAAYKYIPADVKVDGQTWKWEASRYLPVVSSLGDATDFKPADKQTSNVLAPVFGADVAKINDGFGVSYSMATKDFSKDGDIMVVEMKGNVVCGKLSGCPVRVLKQTAGKWTPVFSAATTGDIRIAKTTRDGYRDIVFQTRDGAFQAGWNGKTYSVAERIEGVHK